MGSVDSGSCAPLCANTAATPRSTVEESESTDGLRAFTPAAHRIATVGTAAGVTFVDDSKATNAHAAQTSLSAYEPIVWIAGGMAKGQEFDDLVVSARSRLRAVVLLGVDRDVIAAALARHAPDVPVEEVVATDTGAMREVVRRAAGVAQPGDTVLLAPGCASWDMFRDYAARGRQFAEAVAALPGFSAPGSDRGPRRRSRRRRSRSPRAGYRCC